MVHVERGDGTGQATTAFFNYFPAGGGAVTLSHDPKCRIRAGRVRVRISEATGALVYGYGPSYYEPDYYGPTYYDYGPGVMFGGPSIGVVID